MAKSSTDTYRTKAKSRAKHVKDNSPGGKYAHTKKYKREHSEARRALGIMGKGGKDVVKKNGRLRSTESVKKNRGRGGAQRK